MKTNKNMFFSSKANTLLRLKNKVKNSFILDIIKFNHEEWKKNKKNIIIQIQRKFKNKVILRSSAIDEDNYKQSQAGKYLSLKDIYDLLLFIGIAKNSYLMLYIKGFFKY